MNMLAFVNERIEQALMLTHTAFLAQAVRFHKNRTTLQPLTMIKTAQSEPRKQALIVDAPKLKGLEIQQGDICLCVACERDISQALRGKMSLPANRHHDLTDTVIVGVLETDERV